MALEADIFHADGSIETLPIAKSVERNSFGRKDDASLYPTRPDLNNIKLVEGQDEVEFYEDGTLLFAGILRDVLRGGSQPEIIVDSYERLAMDGERCGGGLKYDSGSSTDTDIYQDAIDDTEGLAAGNLQSIGTESSLVFSYASPAKRIRTTAEAVGAEIEYQYDKTVDVVDSLGSDKTNITLSPSNQNISGDFNPERESGNKRVTHLVMLGAGEGTSQVQALLVPEADPADYENDSRYRNVTRYTASNWSSGDRAIWDARSNKDIKDADMLTEHGLELIDEWEKDSIEISLTVKDHDVSLGDEFSIKHPKENVNTSLRAVEVIRTVDEEGRSYETTFSNRRKTRGTDTEDIIKDSERYNMAFEGTNVTMTTGGGRQPVDGNNNYQFYFYYPAEVTYEHRVELFVRGLNYRYYSDPQPHSHPVNVSPATQSDSDVVESSSRGFTDDEIVDSAWETIHTFTPLVNGERLCVNLGHSGLNSNAVGVDFRLYSSNNDEYFPDTTGTTETFVSSTDDRAFTRIDIPKNVYNDEIAIQAQSTDSSVTTRLSWQWWLEGNHTHNDTVTVESDVGVQAGIQDTANAPSGCDVLVNGAIVEYDVINGIESGTADLSGHLTPGAVNEVEIRSDSLGHIQAHLDIDVYRQILGNG